MFAIRACEVLEVKGAKSALSSENHLVTMLTQVGPQHSSSAAQCTWLATGDVQHPCCT